MVRILLLVPVPKEFVLTIDADINQTSMSVEELIELANAKDDDDHDEEYEDE